MSLANFDIALPTRRGMRYIVMCNNVTTELTSLNCPKGACEGKVRVFGTDLFQIGANNSQETLVLHFAASRATSAVL